MGDYTYMSVEEIGSSKKYPFSEGMMRGWLLKREENGLNKCVFKVGKRLVIRSDLFDAWIESRFEETN